MAYITPVFLINNDINVFEIESLDSTMVKKVLVDEKSVSQGEFYKAQAIDIKLELKIEVRRFEYKNQEYFLKDNELYMVLRSYKNGGKYELNCTKENIRIKYNGN